MRRFPLDKNYSLLLRNQNISISEVLRRAGLPEDLFARKDAFLTDEEYMRFMDSIEQSIENPQIPILLATAENIESINPPIFAAYCSKDARHCIKRLAQYKALAGAVCFDVQDTENEIAVTIHAVDEKQTLPEIIVGIEMVLLTNLIRKATKQNIIPHKIIVEHPFQNPEYEKFLSCTAEIGTQNQIIFSSSDAKQPFISRNDSMWDFFEPELKKRLAEMELDDTFSARVRSALVELLPGGQCTIDDVCDCLGISKRTLQRKLAEEDTTFQKQLNHTRELLAKNYINHTNLPSEEIAFLLGYQDTNSFFRAFSLWTGKSITEYKQKI
jgi:AraC-like DNA-binding protein